MENREELYDRTPFYMTYPIQNLYLAEMEYEKDMERMKELYPREVQQLVKMIEQRCDELEYEGSRMYDENPDRAMMEEEACRLFERFLRENPQYDNMMPPPPPMPQPDRPMPRPDRPMPRPDSPMPRPGVPNRFPIMPPEEFRDMMPEPAPQPGMPMRPGMPPQPQPGMPMPRPGMPPQPQREEVREELSAQNRRDCQNSWLCSLIQVIFNDEVYRRRCRNRRCRRWSM